MKAFTLGMGLKLGALASVAVLVAVAFTATQPPKAAQASPQGVIVLNSAICVALGSAFGGIPAIAAQPDCAGLASQDKYQDYVHALKKIPGNDVITTSPADFKTLDLDKNQVHEGQELLVIAFVNDGFPVHFKTDKGSFYDNSGGLIGKDYYCNDNSPFGRGDQDCDTNPATLGDGVVVAHLKVSQATDYDPLNDANNIGHITVIQEAIGFPVTFTIVGKPELIVLTPLFGKDKISTGGTPPTLSHTAGDESDPGIGLPIPTDACVVENPCANVLPTDCNFAATVDGVLGATNAAEKTVVVAKAKDNEGHDVVGVLLDWTHPLGPATTGGVTLFPTSQGGVALPQTPTLDAGALGVGFPQFVCSLDSPGDLVLTVTIDPILEPAYSVDPKIRAAKTDVTIHVIDAASTIALVADPSPVACNGTNTSKVTASVSNKNGEPAANGLDVNFSVVALGIANPLKADTAAGAASTVVTPLFDAGVVASDGGSAGVTVTVSANGQRSKRILKTRAEFPVDAVTGLPSPLPSLKQSDIYFSDLGTQAIVQSQILVACSGGAPVPAAPVAPAGAANGGGAAGAGAQPSGVIRGPDTGSGPAGAGGAGSLRLWMLAALGGGALSLVGVGKLAARRR